MRYIGCKRRLLPMIHQALKEHHIEGGVFCDLFAGTATVGHYFKQQGFSIISNDFLQASYAQQRVKIVINAMPEFNVIAKELGLGVDIGNQSYAQAIVDYLNQLPGVLGFMYQHYSPSMPDSNLIMRLYFTVANAMKIDAIRETIESWRLSQLINDDEFYVLLYALLEAASRCANTTGTQTAFLKYWAPNALRALELRLPDITSSDKTHTAYCQDSLSLIATLQDIDVLYLDPPYTRKQYAAAYHLLETIAQWDRPSIRGVSGARDTKHLASTFSRKTQALGSLKQIIAQGNYKHLLLSYSSDGLIPHDAIVTMLSQYGEPVVYTHQVSRYESNSGNSPFYHPKRQVVERLYYLNRASINDALLNTFPLHSMSSKVSQF